MSRAKHLWLVGPLTAIFVLAAGCDEIGGGGPRELVFNERICVGQTLFRMRLGQETRVIADNREPASTNQTNLVVRLERMPLTVDGDVPESSTIGNPFSTIVLEANRGERATVDVIPTGIGQYQVVCNVTEGGAVAVLQATMQIIEED